MDKLNQKDTKINNPKDTGVIKAHRTDIPLLRGHITHLINSGYK